MATFAALYEKATANGRIAATDDMIKITYYQGYVNGVANMSMGKSWCSNGEIYMAQAWGVVAKFIRENPAK